MKIKVSIIGSKFKLPSFEEEEGEFDRYNFSKEEKELLKKQFLDKNLKMLSNKIWSQLNNTNSWEDESQDIEYVEKIAQQEGKDFPRIVNGIKTGNIPAPIILHKDGKYELIAGNTRLMVSRALKIRPTVLMIKL